MFKFCNYIFSQPLTAPDLNQPFVNDPLFWIILILLFVVLFLIVFIVVYFGRKKDKEKIDRSFRNPAYNYWENDNSKKPKYLQKINVYKQEIEISYYDLLYKIDRAKIDYKLFEYNKKIVINKIQNQIKLETNRILSNDIESYKKVIDALKSEKSNLKELKKNSIIDIEILKKEFLYFKKNKNKELSDLVKKDLLKNSFDLVKPYKEKYIDVNDEYLLSKKLLTQEIYRLNYLLEKNIKNSKEIQKKFVAVAKQAKAELRNNEKARN